MTPAKPEAMTEPIPSAPGYRASSDGRIWSEKTSRWLKPYAGRWGYQRVSIWGGSRGLVRQPYVHALVAETFIGPRPEGEEVNHLDNDKRNNAADNLEYTTPAGNIRHSVAIGAHPKGERHGSAKLTARRVRRLRRLRAEGLSLTRLGEIFGIHRRQVQRIVEREHWSHVT